MTLCVNYLPSAFLLKSSLVKSDKVNVIFRLDVGLRWLFMFEILLVSVLHLLRLLFIKTLETDAIEEVVVLLHIDFCFINFRVKGVDTSHEEIIVVKGMFLLLFPIGCLLLNNEVILKVPADHLDLRAIELYDVFVFFT